MANIYAYAPDAAECASIGLVGALMDQDARFELRAGEFGELSFTHPRDPWGKWRALRDGVVLKALVPVRLAPEVDDGAYAASVDTYVVSAAATRYQRYVYYAATAADDPTRTVTRNKKKYQKTRHKKLLKHGAQVTVIGNPRPNDDAWRLKVRVGAGRGKVTGYMEKAGLTPVRQAVPVPAAQDGLEADMPSYALRQQLFRIYEVDAASDAGDPGSVAVRARRLVYDLLGNICTYRTEGSVTCQQACRGILENTAFSHPFQVYSDIGERHVGIDVRDMNPIAALIDPETGAAAHWGGEVVCDDYDIYVLRRAGIDRGICIRYGRDLAGVRCRADSSNVVTAIRPVGEKAGGAPLYLDGHVVDGRCGYNYSSATHTCANWLPEGFRWALDDDGSREGSIVERDIDWDGYAAPMAAALPVKDAKVSRTSASTDPNETSVLTAPLARVMLAEAAVARFRAGCDVPELSLEVDFTLLGDAEEYAQYRHLEPLFVYDAVVVRHPKLAMAARVRLTALSWAVRGERVTAAAFGAPGDAVARIPGWQIAPLDGGKLLPGTVDGGRIGEGAIAAQHLQAESVNADAIQARAVTAEKIAAGAVSATHIAAGSVTADKLAAGAVDAGMLSAVNAAVLQLDAAHVDAQSLAAVLTELVHLTARTADIDYARVKDLSADAAVITNGEADTLLIRRLSVTTANLMNAIVGNLVLKGADGGYYAVRIGSDGAIHVGAATVTQGEIDAAETADGRRIVETSANIAALDGESLRYNRGVFGSIVTDALTVTGRLSAVEGFIASAELPSIRTAALRALGDVIDIRANDSLLMSAGDDSGGLRRVLRLNADGLHVGDNRTAHELRLTGDGVDVVVDGATYSRFAARYAQFGAYQIREAHDGGLVFKLGDPLDDAAVDGPQPEGA